MTDTNDDDRRPPRGGPRGRPPARGGEGRSFSGRPGGKPPYGGKPGFGSGGAREGGKSFLTRRPRADAAPPERPRRVHEPEARPAGEAAPPAEERIAKVIARAGLASRREAEGLIEAGRVTLDGAVVASPALNVGPDARIAVDGEPLPSRERTRLWLFHKPRGLVTTFRDPEGRPTVFDSLPEDMPRVVAIGRLDINTEGLLLLTNDGGIAKVIAQPATGWTRRYRARAHGGEVTQAQLDKLKGGITIDGMEYGPVEAVLDRVQGDNSWISLSLREGKNREVKRILEHLGLQVNRLIRLSFGPFQLGELEQGLVEEIRTKVLREQLGQALAAEAGADFESPVRTPIAPFGKEPKVPARPPRPRRAGEDDRGPRGFGPRRGGDEPRGRGFGPQRERSFGERGSGNRGEGRDGSRDRPRAPREEKPRDTVWRADDEARPPRPPRRDRREDPQAERAAAAERPRRRDKPIESRGGRVLVERMKPREDDAPRHRRERGPRPEAGEGPREDFRARPGRAPRGTGFDREERRGPPRPGGNRGGVPSRNKPDRAGPPGRGGKPGFGGKPGGKPGFGGKPGGGPKGRRG